MIPRHLHTFWQGPKSKEVSQFMYGMARSHPRWITFFWDAPSIELLGLNFKHLKDKCVNMASVSNVVRIHALSKYGGIWMDSDCEVLKPLDPLLKHSAFASEQDAGRICNAVMGAESQHPWIDWQLARQDRLMNADAANGVYLASEAPRDFLTILPTEYFYPFLWDTPLDERKAHPDSYLIHHWSGSWTKKP
jgi:mannosyltransferase OCH1-like enzyme